MQKYLEVACDESGWSGTNLLDVDNPVLTHASVHLDTADAAAFVSAALAAGSAGTRAAWIGALLFGLSPFSVEIAQFSRFYGLQMLSLFVAAVYIVLNLIVDVLYGVIDPRVRT